VMESQYCRNYQYSMLIIRLRTVTYFVDHHDSKEVAYSGKEESVEIVLHVMADGITKDIVDHLPDDEEKDTESNVTKWPPVLQRVRDEDDLHYHVDEQADTIDYVENHKKPDSIGRSKAGPSFERQQRNGARDDKHAE